MSTALTRHQSNHTRPQEVDMALLATRCYCFTAQLSGSLLPILESEVGGGDSCETASTAGSCPAEPRAASSSPAGQEGEHRRGGPWTFCSALSSRSSPGAGLSPTPCGTSQDLSGSGCSQGFLLPSIPRPRGMNLTMGVKCVL